MISGAAMAAALVFCGFAAWQTWRLAGLIPDGTPTTAHVLSREMRRPYPEAALAESVVLLSVTDPTGGTFTAITPHPPISLTEVWPGASVSVVVNGTPPEIAYMPEVPMRKRNATMIALAIVLGLAALFGLLSRLTRP